MSKGIKLVGTLLFWLAWPALYVYLRKSKRCRIVVIQGNSILLIKNWLGSDQFTLPGGGFHKNEDPIEAVVRELEEETGIRAEKTQIKQIKSEYSVIEKGLRYQCHGFVLVLKNQPTMVRQKFEISELKWVSVRDILSKYQLSPVARELITTWLADNHLLD